MLDEDIAVFVRIGKIFIVLALVATLGAHWALLQTVAWTTMLANNLQSGSFHQAVTKTFDGNHPCCLCKAIAAAKKSEKKSEAVSPTLKMEFPPAAANFTLISPEPISAFSLAEVSAAASFQKPPLPPPRGFFV
jgi:hypothetical protein